MGLTVKRNNDLEKMMSQFTTKTAESETEKEKRDKFLAKDDKNKDKKK